MKKRRDISFVCYIFKTSVVRFRALHSACPCATAKDVFVVAFNDKASRLQACFMSQSN